MALNYNLSAREKYPNTNDLTDQTRDWKSTQAKMKWNQIMYLVLNSEDASWVSTKSKA